MRVYLDTNVLVSAFATRGLCADVLHLVLTEHQLVAGEGVLAEVRRILHQKIRLSPAVVREADTFLRQQALVVDVAPPLTIAIRDPDDRIILSEAVAGQAEVLVTGDRDLLDIAAEAPLPIMTPRSFWAVVLAARDPNEG